jgi:hypothetical protein
MENKVINNYIVSGESPISDTISTKPKNEHSDIKSSAFRDKFEKIKLPFDYSDGKYTITIKKVEMKNGGIGVWYYATRDGKSVAAHSPHWTYNIPVLKRVSTVLTSDVKGVKTFDHTLKEDILQVWVDGMVRYLDNCPLGEPIGDDVTDVYASVSAHFSWYGDAVFSTPRNITTGGISTGDNYVGWGSSTTSNQFSGFWRTGLTFNTSSIGTDSISAVTFKDYCIYGVVDLGYNSYGLTAFTPDNASSYTGTDMNNFADTRFATDLVPGTDLFDSQYNTWTLNASGIANINKTGNTTIFLRDGWDIDNSFGGSWGSEYYSAAMFNTVEGAVDLPYLSITHAPSVNISKQGVSFGSANMMWI